MTGAITAGKVVEFDAHRGLGLIDAEDGRQLAFHCTSIFGGSRSIDVDTAVTFNVVARHHGRWEASEVTPVQEG